MTSGVTFRRAKGKDIQPAYGVFRRSLYDYLHRQAIVDKDKITDALIEEDWQRQLAWIQHLWSSAAENWIAIGADGHVVGWALSVSRDGHLELTHLFVDPATQGRGIGRKLLNHAFSGARHKSLVASQDTKALSLYLRSGLNYVTTAAEFVMAARHVKTETDLKFRPVVESDADVEAIIAIERQILGYRREVDVRFILRQRPGWLALRDGAAAGFAFGVQPRAPGAGSLPAMTGPIAALDPSDMPALLDHVINEAAKTGEQEFSFQVPFINRIAVRHLLGQGGKIEPFYVEILASDDAMRLDRWIHTTPMFIL